MPVNHNGECIGTEEILVRRIVHPTRSLHPFPVFPTRISMITPGPAQGRRAPPATRRGPRSKDRNTRGLKVLRATDSRYTEVLSYRRYRLENTSRKRRIQRTRGRSRTKIKRLDLTLSKHVFDGSDPIRVLSFLDRFVREANILEISEAQAI